MSTETRDVEGLFRSLRDADEVALLGSDIRAALRLTASLREQVESLQHKLGAAAQEIPEVAGPVDHRIRMIRASLSEQVERLERVGREFNRERFEAVERAERAEARVAELEAALRTIRDGRYNDPRIAEELARRALDTKGGE